MKIVARILTAMCFLGSPFTVQAQTQTPKIRNLPLSQKPVSMTWDMNVPMRDGVNLKGDLYLQSETNPSQVYRAGKLATAAKDSPVARYVYDPKNIKAAEWQSQIVDVGDYVDTRSALAVDGDGLVYHSEALTEDRVFVGHFQVGAYLAMVVRDTDFAAELYEVKADGSQILIGRGEARARYRQSLRKPVLVTPRETQLYTLRSDYYNYRTMPKGSFLRLVIRALNDLTIQKNYNGGGDVSAESGKDAKTANVILHQAAKQASFIEIPWRKAESK